jgi:hypothetical protein
MSFFLVVVFLVAIVFFVVNVVFFFAGRNKKRLGPRRRPYVGMSQWGLDEPPGSRTTT